MKFEGIKRNIQRGSAGFYRTLFSRMETKCYNPDSRFGTLREKCP